MKERTFKSKLLIKPCRKILNLFKFRFKRPFFIIRTLRFRQHRDATEKTHQRKRTRTRTLLSVFRSPRRLEKMDEVGELRSMREVGRERLLFPSPLTPAYVRTSGAAKREVSGDHDEVEDACRSFENYLVEMIVEEGKVRDLMDVEELLCCWKNLKCPIFIDLVCRFYGELCKDLFSGDKE